MIFENAGFKEGRISSSSTSYYQKDHLGSVRVIFDAGGVLKEENDYYPFGLQQARANYTQQGGNRFKYNGKEEQTTGNLGYLDYGARPYDPYTGRWLSVDPLTEKYYGWSPYGYCVGNPLIYVDPDGKKVRFAKGVSKQFKEDFAKAVKYLNAHGQGGMLARLEASEKVYYIQEDLESFYTWKTKTIYWNSRRGSFTDEGISLSPTTILNHEIDHALYDDRNRKAFIRGIGLDDKEYGNKEERRVITGSEQRTAQAFGEIKENQVTRKNHRGWVFFTDDPTSTRDIREATIEGKKLKRKDNDENDIIRSTDQSFYPSGR